MNNINEKLLKYRDVDLSNINIDDVDKIEDIKIDKRKSSKDRIIDFLNSVKNPYVFNVDGKLVQIGFSNNNVSADECLTNLLSKLYK